jgi:hypothetical protein
LREGTVNGVSVRSFPCLHLFLYGIKLLPAIDTAQAFWALLLPHGLHGGALSHVHSKDDDDDDDMGEELGWRDEFTSWWFEFLDQKGGKGVSKDTWAMVRVVLSHQHAILKNVFLHSSS